MEKRKRPLSGWVRRAGVAVTAAATAAALAVSPASASAVPASAAAPLAAVGPAMAAAPMAAAAQAVSFDAQMVELVNRARASVGAPALAQAKGLTQLSVWWSSQMQNGSTGYSLQHNPNAWTMVTTYGASNRTSWGENVAWSSSTGTTAAQLFTAYMNSPDHKANILAKNYRFIGMGTVTGAHGLFNTTEFTDAVNAGQGVVTAPAPVAAPVNGDFVRSTTTGAVYRIVGGAPVYVSSWAPFGRAQTAKPITQAKLVTMRLYPADGTFVRAAGDYSVYRIIGGAPVYVSSWAAFGATQPTVDIDPAAITHAGAGGVWSHLRQVPGDGIFIRVPTSGAVYRMAGGAPIYVASWAPFGGAKTTYAVDPAAVSHAGQANVWAHIKMYPATTTYIKAAGATVIYKVVGGKLSKLASWPVTGATTYTVVHPLAISLAGSGGYYNHLKK